MKGVQVRLFFLLNSNLEKAGDSVNAFISELLHFPSGVVLSLIHSLIQQTFIEHILYSRYRSGYHEADI